LAQVGAPVPAEKRLKFASELFDVVDVGGQRVLDAHKLQARRLALAPATQHPWRFSSDAPRRSR
jgi:hypothetical protein